MQVAIEESFAFGMFEIGISIIFLIGYILFRQSKQGKDRFLECFKIMAVSIIFIQFYALYLGITHGNALGFYYIVNLLYSGNLAIMLCDITLQYSALCKENPTI